MADSPQDLLSNPEFQKLSPEAQHIVISTKFPEYAKLSPEAQKIVLSKAAPPEPKVMVPMGMGEQEPIMMTPKDAEAFHRHEIATARQALMTGVGILTGGATGGAGWGLLGRAGAAGTAVGATSLITGGSPEEALKDAATQGALPEVGGALLGKVGEGLSSVASKALARILRLSPKAFQFGKEPAAEVLEQGIAGNSLPKLVENIGVASKQTTAQLNSALQATKGTVNGENAMIDVANAMPGKTGDRFLTVVSDAMEKQKIPFNKLSNLSAVEANALKQEIAKQGRFVEGDLRASMANASKQFGGKLKDALIKLNPDVEDLLQSSANLTEAAKSGDYAVRMDKAGRGKGPLADVEANRPATYPHILTDSTTGAKTLFRIANMLKDTVGTSNALRTAFSLVYPNAPDIL